MTNIGSTNREVVSNDFKESHNEETTSHQIIQSQDYYRTSDSVESMDDIKLQNVELPAPYSKEK